MAIIAISFVSHLFGSSRQAVSQPSWCLRAASWIVGQACIYETGEYRFHRKLMAPPAAIEGTVKADLFRLLKAHGRTRSASRKALSPSYATILRALKKIMKSPFLRKVAHDKRA